MATKTILIINDLAERLGTIDGLNVRVGLVDAIGSKNANECIFRPLSERLEYKSSQLYQATLQVELLILCRGAESIGVCEDFREKVHFAITAEPFSLSGKAQTIRHTQTEWDFADGELPTSAVRVTYEFSYPVDWKKLA